MAPGRYTLFPPSLEPTPNTTQNSYSDAPTSNALGDLLPSIFSHTTVTLPSNITRICRALNTNSVATEDTEPRPAQIVFYHPGIGTDGGIEDRIIGGATGATISLHISECYGFLCNNWQVGDEIFLFGFSRGAYTARAIATLITDIGLLTAKGMEFFFQIFEDWKDQNVPEVLEKQMAEEKINGARGAFKGLPATPPMPSKDYTDVLYDVGPPPSPSPNFLTPPNPANPHSAATPAPPSPSKSSASSTPSAPSASPPSSASTSPPQN